MAIARDSMRYRLAMEGRLSNNVRRAALEHLESIWDQKVAPSLWARDESSRSNIGMLSEDEEATRARMRDVELTKQKHSWLCKALDKLEQDPDAARSLANEGARRGDLELPASMQPPRLETDMERQYATMRGSVNYDPEAVAVEPSRLNLQAEPALLSESPRVSAEAFDNGKSAGTAYDGRDRAQGTA